MPCSACADVYKHMHTPAGLVGKVESQTDSFCVHYLYRSFSSLCGVIQIMDSGMLTLRLH